MKTFMMLSTVVAALAFGSEIAQGCENGHYEVTTVVVEEAKTRRVRVRQWVPGCVERIAKTVTLRSGRWQRDAQGRYLWVAPVTRKINEVKRSQGCYKMVWKTQVIPGSKHRVKRLRRVWICHCNEQSEPTTRLAANSS